MRLPSDLNSLAMVLAKHLPWSPGIIIGTSGPDRLPGTGAADLILGLAGGDTVEGLGSGDRLLGGPGGDLIHGGDIDFRAGLVDGNDTMSGGSGDDTLYGGRLVGAAGDGDNLILGGSGKDSITAGWGADTVLGGPGNDTILGQGSSFGIPFNAFAQVLQQEPADWLYGGGGDDSIDGGGGADTLLGGPGDDSLTGSFGADVLIGGPGADSFIFRPPRVPFPATPDTGVGEGNRDLVLDFRQGQDMLDLSGYDDPARFFQAGDPAQLDLPEPVFLGTGAFVATNALQVRYEVLEGGRTLVQFATPLGAFPPPADAAPAVPAQPTGEIELAGVRALTAEDFLL